jgi:hypothetical protein
LHVILHSAETNDWVVMGPPLGPLSV